MEMIRMIWLRALHVCMDSLMNLKKETWRLVQNIRYELGERLILFGDFNDVIQHSEKLGGNSKLQSQFLWSRETMEMCGLQDLGFVDYPFTWSNGRTRSDNIQCRLDSGHLPRLGSDFLDVFPLSRVVHLPRHGSDHVMLRIMIEEEEQQQKKNAIFRFEEVWAKDERCEGCIRNLWREPARSFTQKLSGLQKLKHSFKDLGTGKIAEEVKKIQTLLNEEIRWLGDAEEI